MGKQAIGHGPVQERGGDAAVQEARVTLQRRAGREYTFHAAVGLEHKLLP
jgi:hypothetical protein